MSYQTVGVWPLKNGDYFFRVWAPHAEAVRVLLQSGPHWDSNAPVHDEPLTGSNDGYWSTALSNIRPGLLYRYAITHRGKQWQKLDPAARDVIHSGLTRFDTASNNAAIVPGPDLTEWVVFTPPAFENFIVYQLHIGSFACRNDNLQDKTIAGFADVSSKFGYLRELGFNAIELLPVHEFAADRSWGYNPASFFAPESAYGSPDDLRTFVNQAHAAGLAVIFDVVYNHAGPGDNVLWDFDHEIDEGSGGSYFEGGQMTHWGLGPAWWKHEVQDYFFENACMFLEDYHGDGLRFDATTQINGNHLSQVIQRLKQRYPDRYLIAEHLPADPWITTFGNFDATWQARVHHECQRALNGDAPIARIKSILGWDGFAHSWNLAKYTMGSHDDCGDQENGDAEHGLSSWDSRHRYFIDQFGGRDNPWARAKCRLAWALNIAMPGTPMLFMGNECHMGAPQVAWGYWHDGHDTNGDHRFDWSIAGDPTAMTMHHLVRTVNNLRWQNPALRSETLAMVHEDHTNQVLAFKRWQSDNVVLCIINLSDNQFQQHNYGIATGGQEGRWQQILCSQDAAFGGRDGAGNAYYDPWTQADGRIYINLPEWSVVIFRLIS